MNGGPNRKGTRKNAKRGFGRVCKKEHGKTRWKAPPLLCCYTCSNNASPPLPDTVGERLQQASTDELHRWAVRVLDARTLNEIFE